MGFLAPCPVHHNTNECLKSKNTAIANNVSKYTMSLNNEVDSRALRDFAKAGPPWRRPAPHSWPRFGSNPLRILGLPRSTTIARSGRDFPKSCSGSARPRPRWRRSPKQIVARGNPLLVTRADEAAWQAVKAVVPDAEYHALARCITVKGEIAPGKGTIVAVLGRHIRPARGRRGRGDRRDARQYGRAHV